MSTITNIHNSVKHNGNSVRFSLTQERIDLLERQMQKVIDCIESISNDLDAEMEEKAEIKELIAEYHECIGDVTAENKVLREYIESLDRRISYLENK